MACAGIGGLERGVDFFLKFDAERVNIFPVWRKEEDGWLFSYEDAGPPKSETRDSSYFREQGVGSRSWLAGCIESRLKEFKKAIAHTTGIGSVIFSYN